MATPLLVATRRRLDAAFARFSQLQGTDLELQADYAKYLCILVSGYVEVAVSELAIEHCEKRSTPSVHSYISSQLDKLQNVKAERLLQLLGSFDAKWRVDLEAFLDNMVAS